jgi:hypothetical protein
MKKWALSAIAYLLVVTGAYYAYTSFSGTELKENNHAKSENEHNTGTESGHSEDIESDEHGQDHGDGHSTSSPTGESQVVTTLTEEDGNLIVTLKNLEGKSLLNTDIDINHEKLMHLIVVSTDLKQYYHLHPEFNGSGVFSTPHTLTDGDYKVFVDIKPKQLAYEVEPLLFTKGSSHGEHAHGELEVDTSFVRHVGDYSVTLQTSSFHVNEEILLEFDLNGDQPEQHLGALGHVVILDEKADNYIHVHPLHGDQPVFATSFSQPGIYKIWAEFKFNNEVNVFPYVIEVK